MNHAPGPKMWWAIWMTLGGFAVGAVVLVLTSSLWWALVGMLAAGVVFNAIAGPRWPNGHTTHPTGI